MKRVSSKCGNLVWLRKDLPCFYAYWYICPFRENTSEAKEWHGTRETFDFPFLGIYYFYVALPNHYSETLVYTSMQPYIYIHLHILTI